MANILTCASLASQLPVLYFISCIALTVMLQHILEFCMGRSKDKSELYFTYIAKVLIRCEECGQQCFMKYHSLYLCLKLTTTTLTLKVLTFLSFITILVLSLPLLQTSFLLPLLL